MNNQRLPEQVADYIYTVTVKNGKPAEIIHRPGCERITGRTLEEFEADSGLWFQIVYGPDRTQVFGLAQHMLAKPDIYTLEYRIFHKDGSIRWVTSTLIPCRNMHPPLLPDNDTSSGVLLSYDAFITDITRRKVADEYRV